MQLARINSTEHPVKVGLSDAFMALMSHQPSGQFYNNELNISGYSFLQEMGEYQYKVSGRYEAFLKVLVLVMAQIKSIFLPSL